MKSQANTNPHKWMNVLHSWMNEPMGNCMGSEKETYMSTQRGNYSKWNGVSCHFHTPSPPTPAPLTQRAPLQQLPCAVMNFCYLGGYITDEFLGQVAQCEFQETIKQLKNSGLNLDDRGAFIG